MVIAGIDWGSIPTGDVADMATVFVKTLEISYTHSE